MHTLLVEMRQHENYLQALRKNSAPHRIIKHRGVVKVSQVGGVKQASLALMTTSAFAAPCALPVLTPRRHATCRNRQRFTPCATADWEKSPSWQAGQSAPQKGLVQIEFTIRQDGVIEEKVTGVKGKDCVQLTAKVEKALGRILHREDTEEAIEEVVSVQPVQVVQPGDALYVDDPNIPSW